MDDRTARGSGVSKAGKSGTSRTMTKPLSPKDVETAKASRMSPKMIEAANELISESWDGYEATFTLNELISRARKKLGMPAHEDFPHGALDIEPVFRKAGWYVEFDKPGYNETYNAFFTFRKRGSR